MRRLTLRFSASLLLGCLSQAWAVEEAPPCVRARWVPMAMAGNHTLYACEIMDEQGKRRVDYQTNEDDCLALMTCSGDAKDPASWLVKQY